MIEFIEHALGLCGEPHLNIFHIILSASLISTVAIYLKAKVLK